MDVTTRTNIVAAAVVAAGPQGDDLGTWAAKVQSNAIEIALMAENDSEVAKVLNVIQGASDANNKTAKAFTGTVISVKKEASSTRGVVTLHTGTDRVKEGLAEGQEQVRTERTDNPAGLAMAKKMQGLKGHKVLVFVEIEEYGNGAGKVRVLRHVRDLGVDPEFAEQPKSA